MKHLESVVLSVCIVLAGALTVRAQSITMIYTFNKTNGANPWSSLTLGPDGSFYGTTMNGGSGSSGTVFRVTTNGMLTTLASFSGTNGAKPQAGLTLGPDGNFYGTTSGGGGSSNGTVFQITLDGKLTTLVSFSGANGATPLGNLTLGPDGNLYGTTYSGGSSSNGTVFKVTTNGILTDLISFNKANGASPEAGLTLGPDGNFYGTTYSGGVASDGTVFEVTTNGAFKTLAAFYSATGINPVAGLTLGPDGNFYGVTFFGGAGGGAVFKVTTNGTLTKLDNLGENPNGSLALGPDGNFYGSTFDGGSYADGDVFKVTTNGTLTTLASFNGTNGAAPRASLTLGPDGNFYSTTMYTNSASMGYGTIFRLDLPPDFITAPANQTVVIGGSANFNCLVFGTAPFAYQWLSNGVPISGATNASLSISPALTNAMGNYQLMVTNAYGSITSQNASLNVLFEPNIYAVTNNGGHLSLYLGSHPNGTNRLWATTNLALDQWQVIATNVTDSNGLGEFTDTNIAGVPQKFYRLSYP